mmetsp:Transcript_19501/g.31009  ORF Transcript_19501/g.31009 Transcript_19501/m.31009 type:complete len:422 (-) Transcript_19501:55-1320(-)
MAFVSLPALVVVLSSLLGLNIGCFVYSCCSTKRSRGEYAQVSVVAADSESDVEDDNKLKSKEKQNRRVIHMTLILAFISMILLLVAAWKFVFDADLSSSNANKNDIEATHVRTLNDVNPDKVLANTRFVIMQDTPSVFSGLLQMTLSAQYEFSFVSQDPLDLSFHLVQEDGAEDLEWIGFRAHGHEDGHGVVYDLYHADSAVTSFVFSPQSTMDGFLTSIFNSFAGSELAQSLVALSIKLKYMGYAGYGTDVNDDEKSNPVLPIHRLAKMLYSKSLRPNVDASQWMDFRQEIEIAKYEMSLSANIDSDAQERRSLQQFSYYNYDYPTPKPTEPRCLNRMAGCDNDCMGMCGLECSCWSTDYCGDACQPCWQKGCSIHDYWCSCSSAWNGCCSIVVMPGAWRCDTGYTSEYDECNDVPSQFK